MSGFELAAAINIIWAVIAFTMNKRWADHCTEINRRWTEFVNTELQKIVEQDKEFNKYLEELEEKIND